MAGFKHVLPPRGIAAGLVLILAMAGGVAFGAAQIPTSTSITFINRDIGVDRTDYFAGQILSPKSRCVVGRKVRLFRPVGGPDPRIGSGRSKRSGLWTIGKEDPHFGFYYVKVFRKRVTVGGRTRFCKGARSGNLPVEPN